MGGVLASSAISNAYYPKSNRGVGLVFENFAISSATPPKLVNWHSHGIGLRPDPGLNLGCDGTVPTCHFSIEVEIGGSHASDKSRSTTERQVLNCPLYENQDPALKLHNVHQVDKSPNQPGRQTRKVHAENVGHCSRPSNYRQISFIEIGEGLLLWLPAHFPRDRFRGVSPLLHRNLRHTRQRLSARVQGEGQISDDIDVWKLGNSKVGGNFDPSAAVGLRSSAF